MVSFWEDYYSKRPVESKRLKDGKVMFKTGDPFIDKWERELAAGLTPDLLEGLPIKERDKEKQNLEKYLKQKETIKKAEELTGFIESYGTE